MTVIGPPLFECRLFAYATAAIGNALVILAILTSRRLRASAINVLLVSMVGVILAWDSK